MRKGKKKVAEAGCLINRDTWTNLNSDAKIRMTIKHKLKDTATTSTKKPDAALGVDNFLLMRYTLITKRKYAKIALIKLIYNNNKIVQKEL